MPLAPDASASEPELIATGLDGFSVTTAQVEEMKKFFAEHSAVETSQEEIERYTVCTFLMAREAERQQLPLPSDFKPQAPIHTALALAQLYVDQTLKHYVLDPLVVESYYRAHVEEYPDQGEASPATTRTAAPWDAVKESIKERLLQSKRQDLAAAQCQDLKKKYAVQGRGARD